LCVEDQRAQCLRLSRIGRVGLFSSRWKKYGEHKIEGRGRGEYMDDRKPGAGGGGGETAFREVIPEPTIYDDGGGGGLTGIAALRWIFPENG
jgi:hypothetical protein